MSFQYTVLGFKPTAFRLRVSSHNNLTKASAIVTSYLVPSLSGAFRRRTKMMSIALNLVPNQDEGNSKERLSKWNFEWRDQSQVLEEKSLRRLFCVLSYFLYLLLTFILVGQACTFSLSIFLFSYLIFLLWSKIVNDCIIVCFLTLISNLSNCKQTVFVCPLLL